MEPRTKYPRTFHLPWSPGATNDDRVLTSTDHFEGQEVVVTVKLDGENTTFYRGGLHARSTNGVAHPSQDWVRAFHAETCHNIPLEMRVCGENLYAVHSIPYTNLASYFQVFSIWCLEKCLSWEHTKEWCDLLDYTTVPILYEGIWNEKLIRGLYDKTFEGNLMEGYVVRLAGGFEDFSKSVAKYVRKNHVQTDEHWKSKPVVANKLRLR